MTIKEAQKCMKKDISVMYKGKEHKIWSCELKYFGNEFVYCVNLVDPGADRCVCQVNMNDCEVVNNDD